MHVRQDVRVRVQGQRNLHVPQHLGARDPNFFEEVGYLHRRGVLRAESVWHTFGLPAGVYWTVYSPTIRKMREEQNDPIVYEDFERLERLVTDLSNKTIIGQEPPPLRNEGVCRGAAGLLPL